MYLALLMEILAALQVRIIHLSEAAGLALVLAVVYSRLQY